MMNPEEKTKKDVHEPVDGSALTFSQIKEIMSLMSKEDITHFRMGSGDNFISLRRSGTPSEKASKRHSGKEVSERDPGEPLCVEESQINQKVRTGHVVTSPVVGVFYDTPAPDQAPYVEVGSFVKKGDVLCIIEAMKLMNEVISPISGKVQEIRVEKASRVEFGQELFVIDPGEKEEAQNE